MVYSGRTILYLCAKRTVSDHQCPIFSVYPGTLRINSSPDSRRLGIIIKTTANRKPSTSAVLSVRHTGLASFRGAFPNTLCQRRSSGWSTTLMRNAMPPPSRNGGNSASTLPQPWATVSRLRSAHTKRISSSATRTMYRTMLLSGIPLFRQSALPRQSSAVSCDFFAIVPPRRYCGHSCAAAHCFTVIADTL